MKRFLLFVGLLVSVALPSCAQNWMPQDSLRLQQLLNGEGEMKVNREVLKELEMNTSLGVPKAVLDKPWLDFNTSLPTVPQAPEKKVVLTLRPYTARTKYNWDPVYQKKIKIDKNTWRGDRFYALKNAKPLPAYKQNALSCDLMYIFTRECWDVKGRKRRARTLEVLKSYGDSTTVLINHPVWSLPK